MCQTELELRIQRLGVVEKIPRTMFQPLVHGKEHRDPTPRPMRVEQPVEARTLSGREVELV